MKATSTSASRLIDGVAEGIATFRSQPHSSYRFVLSFKNDTLQLQLENRKTKQQWCGLCG